jgi:hypothetical protein
MSEHTPVPWVVRVFPTARNANNQYWIMDAIPDKDGKVVANAIASATPSNDEAEANARFIVRACNCHADLLEAVNLLLAAIDFAEVNKHPAIEACLDYATAVIAKAEGEV